MVERPIKKSERQSQVNTDQNAENPNSAPPVESYRKRSKPGENRSSSRGKKASSKDENKPPVNPALVRGPKPVKPQADVKAESESEPEAISEESQS